MAHHATASLLRYAEAEERIERYVSTLAESRKNPQNTETVPLPQAQGRVLAEGIHADRDQPPFPRSTRDGFACRAAEANTHQLLFLAGRVRAGETATGRLETGEVWEIMTGAPVPGGADAVFMVEHADHSSNFVKLLEPRTLQPGENIVPQGAEAHAADLLIPPGIRIGPPQIAMAAQCGYSQLSVVRRPKVAILSTGDELVPIEATPGPSQIRNSNSVMLAALVAAAGGIPVILPTVPDEDTAIDAAVASALPADLLLITGGISAGRFDLVEGALTRAGASFLFGGVAMQPGKPVVFGQLPRAQSAALPFFALPGNPISSAVTFHLFAAPVLAALGEDSNPQPRFALAQLSPKWSGKPGITRFLPAVCNFGHPPEVTLTPWQGSGDIAAFARSNCFAMIPDDATDLPAGSLIQILLT